LTLFARRLRYYWHGSKIAAPYLFKLVGITILIVVSGGVVYVQLGNHRAAQAASCGIAFAAAGGLTLAGHVGRSLMAGRGPRQSRGFGFAR
jgi:hypothetical protein